MAVEILVADQEFLDAVLGDLAGKARRDLGAGLDHDLLGLGVDEIDRRLLAAIALRVEGRAPAFVRLRIGNGLVEIMQDLLGIITQRIKERGDRQLAAPVDADMNDILGVELEIEPGPAIGNDARGKQELAGGMGLALVVVEEDAWRAMHLRDDDALGAVDDERAVRGHERHVAHIDVLLLDVLDGLGAGVGVDFEHDQTQCYLERCGIGHAALLALVDVVFRRLEIVADEFKHGLAGKIADREHRLEDGLEALGRAPALGLLHLQKLVVGFSSEPR